MSDNQFHNAVNQALNFKMPALDIRGIGSSQPTRLDRGLVFDKSEQPLLSGNLGTIQNTNAKVNPNFKRVKPKIVRQFGKETCWAAALESWFSAINDALRQRTQSELLKLNSGAIDVPTFRSIVASFGMETIYISINDFTPAKINNLLDKFSVLLVAYQVATYSPWQHDVVLYDVDIHAAGNVRYKVMNPSPRFNDEKQTIEYGYQSWPTWWFFQGNNSEVLVGYHVKGRAGRVL